MNVIDLLVRDHETVALLFRSFEEADGQDHDTRRDIVEQIHDELEEHAGVEEQVFYPAVERRAAEDPGSGEQVDEAHEEHRLIRDLLTEIAEMQPQDDGYDAKVHVLKDMVQHHVQEEEGRMLPRARHLLGAEELEQMGADIEAERAQIRTERMAVASPDAVIPAPDDGSSDWVRSGDVMAEASAPPSSVSPDDRIASGGPRRTSETGRLRSRRPPEPGPGSR